MSIVTITSEDARLHWRETIDAAYADKRSVVIERYNKPVAVLLNYEEWQATVQNLQRLKELELLHQVRHVKTKIVNGETSFTAHDDLKRLILERRTQKAATYAPTRTHLGD
jgi:PHD/YefM family antitoxin component YafN of YafNO toxin-antitoxin module